MDHIRSLASQVTIPEGIVFRDLQGEAVILNLDTGVYFGLDPVGTRTWHLLRQHGTLQKVLEALLDEYDVTEARCREDLLDLVARMEEQGLVRVSHAPAP
jgi:hypothetical protein